MPLVASVLSGEECMCDQLYPRLFADVGGTNIRLALQIGPMQDSPVTTWNVSDFSSLEDAIRHYLRTEQCEPQYAAIGVANPVVGDQVKLTNYHWSFSIDAMRQNLGLHTLLVMNDFTAQALALQSLSADAFVQIREGNADERAPRVVMGPGTGLGISALLPCPNGGIVALAGEGGHMEVVPQTEDEWIAWRAVHRQYGRVSAERLLCGAGLSQIHSALADAAGMELRTPLRPQLIMDGVVRRDDMLCRRTFEVFCGLLGEVASTATLLLGARGGVYIGGGILPRFIEPLMTSSFQSRFDAAGRLREYLADIPIYIITTTHAAVLGLRYALDEILHSREIGTNGSVLARKA
jgi:glucokinase